MSGNMIESKKGEVYHSLHDLTDYAFSKEVTKDFPKLIEIYRKLLPVLYQYAQYQGVWPVIQMVEDSKMLMEMQLDYYKKVHETKGIVNEEE